MVNAKTRAPIGGAVVAVASPSGSYRATTDAKGNFTIVGVVVDTYTISIQAQGFEPYALTGVTVTPDETYRVSAALSANIKTIGVVRARSIAGAYQPQQTVDRYTLNSAAIDNLQGKAFASDGTSLLSKLPSVTVDLTGNPLIRGGYAFQTSTQVEGIDYTVPSPSVINRFQNSGNLNVLNGVGSVEIIPGGGDATHGDTGTGLISYTIKRGTWPPFTTGDYEVGIRGNLAQFAIEDGRTFGPDSRISNYASLLSVDTAYQYGFFGLDSRSIGASATTPDPNANSNINAHTGSLFTTAFYNTASQYTRDFVDNFIVKLGKTNNQTLQFFYQHQDVTEPENYGGYSVLDYPFVGQNDSVIAAILGPYAQTPSILNQAVKSAYQQYPGGQPGAPLTGPDTAYNPFTAYKIEYNNILSDKSSLGLRYYRTFSEQDQFQASQGLLVPLNGGTRTGVSADLTYLPNSKNSFQFGGKFEFAVPYGTSEDYIDYLPAYGGVNAQNTVIGTHNPVSVIPDFIVPNATTPGCAGTPFSPTSGTASGSYLCGYLSHFFKGAVPALPPETETPTAKQQVYALYGQDTYSPFRGFKALLGLRLDGYNFLIPDDPQNPPAVDGIRHQRLYEPHLGLSYEITSHDAVRANFGRTLAIPLPTFLGNNIARSSFNAYNNIPSYDNTKGPYDPSRPQATQATYCGPGTPEIVNDQLVVLGTQPCTSYADQLYWLMRNYRFGLQSLVTYPLRGATFTNYDFSYSHEFRDGTGLKVTPFYRRGYDVVEATRTLLGFDPTTEVSNLSPEIYSNQGLQKATGVEFDVTHFRPFGFSYQWTGTYINQIGNDPPGTYLPTASLQLGELYRSPELSPFQSTLALTWKTKYGFKINPIFQFKSGYPYGAGLYYAIDYNGQAMYIPLTDAIVEGFNGAYISNGFVNPQNPGTVNNPNLAATRGTESNSSGPGTLHSNPSLTTDITFELTRPNTGITYGFAIYNLFNQIADIPTVNLARAFVPVSTGNYYNTNNSLTSTDPSHTTPTGVGTTFQPYIVYPNQKPLTMQFYIQAKL